MKSIKNLLVVLLAATAQAQAVVVLDNLPLANENVFDQYNNTVYQAVGFTMGGTSYTLTDVVFDVTINGGNPTVALYNWASGNLPGTLVTGSFTISGTANNITATPTGTVTLDANASYYIAVRAANDANTENWYRSNPEGTYTTAVGASFINVASYDNFTATWANFSTVTQPGMEINAVVPEPQAIATLVGLGLIGFAAVRRQWGKK